MTSPDGNASGATAADYTTNYAYDQAGDLATVTSPLVATQRMRRRPRDDPAGD